MTKDDVQTKTQYLMEGIDRLRAAMSEKDTGLIDQRRNAERLYGVDDPITQAAYQKCAEIEADILAMLAEYREFLEEDAATARAEANAMEMTLQLHDLDGIDLLKELGYTGNSENVIEALTILKHEGYRLRCKESPKTEG